MFSLFRRSIARDALQVALLFPWIWAFSANVNDDAAKGNPLLCQDSGWFHLISEFPFLSNLDDLHHFYSNTSVTSLAIDLSNVTLTVDIGLWTQYSSTWEDEVRIAGNWLNWRSSIDTGVICFFIVTYTDPTSSRLLRSATSFQPPFCTHPRRYFEYEDNVGRSESEHPIF